MSETKLPSYAALYAFGDSLSDAGNLSYATGALNFLGVSTEPVSPPYYSEVYGGTAESVFSNGPTWVQNVSIALGLGTLAPTLLDGNDFAYGGAVTGTTPQSPSASAITGLSLPSQLAQYELPTFTPQKNALYTLSIGGNDIFDILSNTSLTSAQQTADINASIANEVSFIQSLAGDGATNFLVLNVPDLGKVPEVTEGLVDGGASSAALDSLASSLASEYNSDLASQLASLETSDKLNITTVNVYSLIDNAVANPAAYGLTNVTAPVWDGNFTASNSGTLAATTTAAQDQYLFFDPIHPTERGEQAIAALAEADLEGVAAPPCYVAGTQIATRRGDVMVQDLRIGDEVHLATGGTLPIIWLGHRQVECCRHPRPDELQPVRIAAGAFAPECPRRDLLLSPDHAVFSDGVLIPARYLINDTTITREKSTEVTYWHVELSRHAVILAEGLACESYLDTGNRDRFANAGPVIQLHPNLIDAPDLAQDTDQAAIWAANGFAPLHIGGPIVEAVAARLRRRSIALGHRPHRRTRIRPPARPIQSDDLAALLQPAWYLTKYPDLAQAGLDPAVHYADHGRAEGRLPCPEIALLRGLGLIDPGALAFTMSDIVAAGVEPVVHFCTVGWREGRRPNRYFDTAWYLAAHRVPDSMNPLLHYVLFGELRGLAPGRDFDPSAYRRHAELGATQCALAHYLRLTGVERHYSGAA